MHPSQATLGRSNKMTVAVPPVTDEQVKVENETERRRRMAVAAGNETASLRLRRDLLHKLGIRDESNKPQFQTQRPARGLLDGVNVTKEPLKYESDEDEEEEQAKSWKERLFFKPSSVESSAEDTAASSVSTMSEDKRLTFNETVSVMPIPMRHEYSQRVRERLWNDVDDIMLNAQRNALEFASEGWDWRTVTEDDYMYRDAASGEMIHPVHMEEQHYE